MSSTTAKGNGFIEGSVTRVKLENFVTYDSVEFTPGPHLNVIIGPNGTGKSTIVCALCLGLAGKTNMLGRATHAQEFVKHGCSKAVIELELHNPNGENTIIRREIFKSKASSLWLVNNRQATAKTVEEMVAHLDIQIGNLTQFLPQDKVADFARMTQQELLENTEKAIGLPEMYENHCKLKRAQTFVQDMELAFKNCAERLDQEKQKNSRLEVEVKNFEERKRHLEKVQLLEMKRPWVVYEEKRQQYQKEKEEKDQLYAQVKESEKLYQPLEEARRKSKEQSDKIDQQITTKNKQISEKANMAARKTRDIDGQTEERTEIQDDLKEKKSMENNRRKKVTDLKGAVESLKQELNSIAENQDSQALLEKCTHEISKTNREMTTVQHQGNTIKEQVGEAKKEITTLKSELTRLQDVSNQRMQMLRAKHRHTHQAVVWLRANRHLFKKTVYEPMMLHINVKDPKYAVYLETRISFDDMRSFLFEDSDEANLFLTEIRQKQKLIVNAQTLAKCSQELINKRVQLAGLKKFGFYGYLNDLFTCPDQIMEHLCRMYTVHAVPVGTRETKNKVEQILREKPDLKEFYTENHFYSVKRSKYSGETSTRCSEVRKMDILTVSIDTNQEEEVKYNLREKQSYLEQQDQSYKMLQKNYKELEKKMEQLRNEKKQLQSQANRKKTLQSQIGTKTQRIQQLEAEAIDINTEEAEAREKLVQVHVTKCKLLEDLKTYTQNCVELSKEKVRLSLRQADALHRKQTIEEELREKKSSQQQLERKFEELKDRMKKTKDEARQLMEVAKKATRTNQKDELSKELKDAFSSCPNTLEDIDSMIHEEKARAECVVNTDEAVVREYEERKRDIIKLQRDSAKHEEALKGHKNDIEKIKTDWMQPLQELISEISNNFRYFFRQLKCAGEVELAVPDNPEEYDKYGIRIKVKFRDAEQLKELNMYHQSGGERSVATVCYMMALQELSKCPFRCVDEINQGMDPINERKIFELVVQTACRPGTSQYFLLTPKLLPDLDFSDRMTVLCIFNGPFIPDHTDWDTEKFIKRLKRQHRHQNGEIE